MEEGLNKKFVWCKCNTMKARDYRDCLLHRFHFSIHSWGKATTTGKKKEKFSQGISWLKRWSNLTWTQNDDENSRWFTKQCFLKSVLCMHFFFFFTILSLSFSLGKAVFHFVKIYMYYYLTRFFSQIIRFIKYSADFFFLFILPANEGDCGTVFPRSS